ncbi:MAG: acetylxylan esterase [Planctomycetaceae bacterium]|nr:acetylxylan esterase [Planctomycetaceae bacterium]MBP60871.1 acetylxylan esterase [Planctomycetaceae bacterium]
MIEDRGFRKVSVVFPVAIVIGLVGVWVLTSRSLAPRDAAITLVREQATAIEEKLDLFQETLQEQEKKISRQEERVSRQEERLEKALEKNTEAIDRLMAQMETPVQTVTPTESPQRKDSNDRRLSPLKDLHGYFPFTPAGSVADWETRAGYVRRQMQVSVGLWPMPTSHPLQAVIHGAVDRPEYTVEKVYFQSLPGLYVSGSLYRPKGESQSPRPAVLCPHGHWRNGRFYALPDKMILDQFAEGSERFFEGGRSALQARCVQLARMGCVVFHYDMVGYGDNMQISYELAHGFDGQRPEMNRIQDWGLFSPQAEAHSQSVMGLATFNSIRALDFLCDLPDVDPERVAVTGASGGGTQTFMLCALDPRPAVNFPAVMVSTAMQGGCTCENACGLRIGTGNVEFAALFAPKPQGLTAADDWTHEMRTKGFPELQQHYQLMGAPDNVMLLNRTEFKHNYNFVSRNAMYRWFNKHLHLELPEPIQERDYLRLTRKELTVWNDDHPRPPGGDELERRVLEWWHQDAQEQLARYTPKDESSWQKYREVVGGAIDVLLGRRLPAAADLDWEMLLHENHGDYSLERGLLTNKPQGAELPVLLLAPKQSNGHVVVWIDAVGKQGLFREADQLRPEILRLLDAGSSVIGVDLLLQGDFLAGKPPSPRTRSVEKDREAAAFPFGYNHTLFARRVHDVLTVLAFARDHGKAATRVDLVGLQGAGHWVAAASAQAASALAPGVIDRVAVDTQGFRFGKLLDIHHPDFLPGAAKYGDLPGMLTLATPASLWLAGEGSQVPDLIATAYQAADPVSQVVAWDGDAADRRAAAVDWLLAP